VENLYYPFFYIAVTVALVTLFVTAYYTVMYLRMKNMGFWAEKLVASVEQQMQDASGVRKKEVAMEALRALNRQLRAGLNEEQLDDLAEAAVYTMNLLGHKLIEAVALEGETE
jgi:hypothetical protein